VADLKAGDGGTNIGDSVMKKIPFLAFGLMTSIVVAGVGASAADNSMTSKSAAQGKIADQDFGRLSEEGVNAFNDIHAARMAIFDGKTDEAAKLIADASESLEKAKTDSAIFMKAESAIHAPGQPAPGPQTRAPKGEAPIAWIPIDGDITVGETYQSSPEKAAVVVEANKSLDRGQGEKAISAIKLAGVDVDYTLAIAPLEESISNINQAKQLSASGDYYGASQALRKAEASVRYDEIDDVADVKGAGKTGAKGK
jgi:hypothetical protein